MYALLSLAVASLLDQTRRAGTAVIAAVGVLAVLSLRYFSSFGLGYEVVQLKELAVYSVGLLCTVAVVMMVLPRDDDPEAAEAQLLSRPVSTWVLSLGAFLGRLGLMSMLCGLWAISLYAALLWFQLSDPRLFGYRGATSAFSEAHAALWPIFGQWLAAAILLALAQPLARTRRPVLVVTGVALLYLLGYAAGGLGDPWARLLPDLARHDLTPGLWDAVGVAPSPGLLLHALVWCAVGLAIDSGAMRAKVAT